MSDRTDPRWDEYLSTGIDPCGFDDEPERKAPRKPYRSSRKESQQEASSGRKVLLAVVVFLLTFGISVLVFTWIFNREDDSVTEEEWKAIEQQKRREAAMQASESYDGAFEDFVREVDSIVASTSRVVNTAKDDFKWHRQPSSVAPERHHRSSTMQRERTPYQQGYWDGYDEGYDDRIQGMEFGYKYDCDGESQEYQRGYQKGYKAGFTEGWEDADAYGYDEL